LIKDLKVRPKIWKVLQERVGDTLGYIGIGNNFLNKSLIPQLLRERIDKCNFIKPESFCTVKKTVTGLKGQPTEWKKIFASSTRNLTRD
jgi:hypothetical protein